VVVAVPVRDEDPREAMTDAAHGAQERVRAGIWTRVDEGRGAVAAFEERCVSLPDVELAVPKRAWCERGQGRRASVRAGARRSAFPFATLVATVMP
jgi:hypothetical protein